MFTQTKCENSTILYQNGQINRNSFQLFRGEHINKIMVIFFDMKTIILLDQQLTISTSFYYVIFFDVKPNKLWSALSDCG